MQARVIGFMSFSFGDCKGPVWGPSTLCPLLPWALCTVAPAQASGAQDVCGSRAACPPT